MESRMMCHRNVQAGHVSSQKHVVWIVCGAAFKPLGGDQLLQQRAAEYASRATCEVIITLLVRLEAVPFTQSYRFS